MRDLASRVLGSRHWSSTCAAGRSSEKSVMRIVDDKLPEPTNWCEKLSRRCASLLCMDLLTPALDRRVPFQIRLVGTPRNRCGRVDQTIEGEDLSVTSAHAPASQKTGCCRKIEWGVASSPSGRMFVAEQFLNAARPAWEKRLPLKLFILAISLSKSRSASEYERPRSSLEAHPQNYDLRHLRRDGAFWAAPYSGAWFPQVSLRERGPAFRRLWLRVSSAFSGDHLSSAVPVWRICGRSASWPNPNEQTMGAELQSPLLPASRKSDGHLQSPPSDSERRRGWMVPPWNCTPYYRLSHAQDRRGGIVLRRLRPQVPGACLSYHNRPTGTSGPWVGLPKASVCERTGGLRKFSNHASLALYGRGGSLGQLPKAIVVTKWSLGPMMLL